MSLSCQEYFAKLNTIPLTGRWLALALTFHIPLLLSFLQISLPSCFSPWAWLITGISGSESLSPGKCVDTHHPVTSNPNSMCVLRRAFFSSAESLWGQINRTYPYRARLKAIWNSARKISLCIKSFWGNISVSTENAPCALLNSGIWLGCNSYADFTAITVKKDSINTRNCKLATTVDSDQYWKQQAW